MCARHGGNPSPKMIDELMMKHPGGDQPPQILRRGDASC